MIWGIVSLILLLIIIGLTIWLLVISNNCPTKKKLNETCVSTQDCNSGLVCSAGGTIGTTTGVSVCKVAYGQTCSISSECSSGQSCVNGICKTPLGTKGGACPCEVGFTCISNVCRAIVGQPCLVGSDCSTGICSDNICVVTEGPTGSSCPSSCSSNTDCSSRSSHSSHSSSSCSSPRSSRDSRSKYYTCSDTDCSKTKYDLTSTIDSSLNSSYSSYHSKSSSPDCRRKSMTSSNSSNNSSYNNSYDCSSPSTLSKTSYDCSSSSNSKSHNYVKRGVYKTNTTNSDSTVFTAIEQPIIDIASYTTKFLLLLENGNLVLNSGITNTFLTTNKKMFRIVRFGSDIVGVDRKGKLYTQNFSNSSGNYWAWEHLSAFPSDAVFINSTNTFTNLEVLTCSEKAFTYVYSTTWKNGTYLNKRKQKDFRYYGKDLTRYIDFDE